MQHDEFLGQVQARGKLANMGQAERVTRSVLETLGERIPDGLAENLAAQLPHEVGEHLRRTMKGNGYGTGESLDRNEFVAHVSDRSGLDRPQAVYATRVVCEVLGEATQGRIMDKVQQSLPPDLREIVTAGSGGEMRG